MVLLLEISQYVANRSTYFLAFYQLTLEHMCTILFIGTMALYHKVKYLNEISLDC